MNRDTESKAMLYVCDGKVRIESYQHGPDGELVEALGTVEGDTGTWLVHIEPGRTYCNCPNGKARQNAAGHAHDRALELAVGLRLKEKQR